MAEHEAPLANADTFIQQLDTLQKELQNNSPGYEYNLREIHRKLSDDQALLHLLKPEQVGIIVAGLKKKTNTVVAEAAVKSRGGGKRAKDITEDDI